jgi:hypothetical protein
VTWIEKLEDRQGREERDTLRDAERERSRHRGAGTEEHQAITHVNPRF